MIRPYISEDLDAIVAIVKKADNMTPAAVQERLGDGWTALVWEDSGAVRGLVSYQKEEDGEFNLRLYVDPSCRRSGIGNALCSAGLEAIAALKERGRITTKYRIDEGDAQRFFRSRGFVYWYSMDSLLYDGPRMRNPNLPIGCEITTYEERYYDDFVRIMADSFFPQRRFFDFRPYDVREIHAAPGDRGRLLASKDNILVLIDHQKVVAIAELEGNFIDTIGVDPSAQGRGHGKALMQQCVNTLLDRGHNVVETSVVLGNIAAWRLYNVLGFRRTQTDEWACRWI